MNQLAPIRRKRSEDGFVLLSVLILLVVFVIAMAVAAPRIAASIQRDRDVETMERGKQYIRAIQLYYRKFNAYPPNIDALVKTNDIRFLRKRYLDPMTGKDDWKLVYFGQNKLPIAYGFFGQPLGGTGGSVIAGTGPSGSNGYPGGTNAGGGLFSGSGSSGGTPMGGMFGNPTSPTAGGSAGSTGSTGSTGGTGTTGSANSGTTDANGNPINGQQVGGGGIIGVSPASPKNAILTYKKKNQYNQWEFTYSPLMDQRMVTGGNAGTVGQPAGGIGQPTTGVGQPGGSFGPTGGNTGSTPIAPPGTTQPQQ
jgi:type II secretory pathway pseudopilin PulG